MRVAVITLSGNDNYGNKLQNYAVVNYLLKMGYDANTIWVTNPFKDNPFRQLLRYYKRLIYDRVLYRKRRKYFLKFNKFLNIKATLIFDKDIKKIYSNYDLFIVGSDQVWNPEYFDNELIYFLSDFDSKKNISLSASIGVDKIPENCIDKYKKGLKNFSYISVRETRAKEIIEKLTGRRDIEVLIDPTMLLTCDEWNQVIKKPKHFNKIREKKYILNYFLGEVPESRYNEIKRIANENECEIINLLDTESPYYNSGPAEFLYLEKNAYMICTDSFHSCVFAILYDVTFVVFERYQKNILNMNSRIDTLLDKLKLKDRKYNGKRITSKNLSHDYTEAYKILNKERKRANDFIKKVLK